MVIPVYRRVRAGAPLAVRGERRPRCGRRADRSARCVLPLVFPAIAAGSIFTFSLTLGDYIAVGIVGGKTQMLANVIYGQLVTANNQPLAAALSDRSRWSRSCCTCWRCAAPARWRTSDGAVAAAALDAAGAARSLGLAFLYVPLALVVLNAFNTSRTFAFPPTGFTLKWWHAAAHSERGAGRAAGRRCKAGLGATAIALVLGTMAAFAVQRYRFFGRSTVSFLVILPIALPGIVTGIALNAAFSERARPARHRTSA